MADLDDATPLEGEPDLSDLLMITVNAETREGRQLSFILSVEEGERLSMSHNVSRGIHHFITTTRKTAP